MDAEFFWNATLVLVGIIVLVLLFMGSCRLLVYLVERWGRHIIAKYSSGYSNYDKPNELTREPYNTIVRAGGYNPNNPETYDRARAFAQEILNDE